MDKNEITLISGAISKAMGDLFMIGGFALTFGFCGFLSMIVAVLWGGQLQVPLFWTGAAMTFACLAFFFYTSFRTKRAARVVTRNLPLLDALQTTAFQATELASVTQSFAFRHLERIQTAVKTVAPIIESLPYVGKAAKDAGLTDAARLSETIVTATDKTKAIVRDLQDAIRKGDLNGIKTYGQQLEGAVNSLKAALAKETAV